ncbi:hypothetical protein KPATCC21470_6136 [Kitasatospora purpeofusca]
MPGPPRWPRHIAHEELGPGKPDPVEYMRSTGLYHSLGEC